MCESCGCGADGAEVTMTDLVRGTRHVLRDLAGRAQHPSHDHAHDAALHPAHRQEHTREVVRVDQPVLAENDRIAAQNRAWFENRGILALNFVSSPGAGKTTLLERTIAAMAEEVEIDVIEGDQMTSADGTRIRAAGARAVQINTGAGCHLEADMIAAAVRVLEPRRGAVLMIENVGNLVCPAMFDLGERMKVVVISTPEGDDKPLKYPHMFRAAELVLINKIDLAPYLDFDEAACRRNIAEVNPAAAVLCLSARSGAGMAAWFETLRKLKKSSQGSDVPTPA